MLPFDLRTLRGVPNKFKSVVRKMVEFLPDKNGSAFLTVDGKVVEKGVSHRRGGAHIDGNFIPNVTTWGSGGWKVGGDGRKLSQEAHKLSYESGTGGVIITSDYPACRGWNGKFDGVASVGGDCSHLENIGEGFMLKPNVVYYGSSQWVHESLPIDKTAHRTLIRINLDMNYPTLNFPTP